LSGGRLNFITNLWPGAQRARATMPPDLVPVSADDFPQPLPQPSADDCWGVASTVSASQRKSNGNGRGRLVLALMTAGLALSVTELAGRMECSVGEASKRVKAAGKHLRCKREGRCKLVRLRQMSLTEWQRLAAEARA
jgi:hypothetical protein